MVCTSCVDGPCRFLRQCESLGMHVVVFDGVDADRLKRSQPDIERNVLDVDSQTSYVVQQLRREMQPCGRCRDRSGLTGINRLIGSRVTGKLLDVGWNLNTCYGPEFFTGVWITRELEHRVTVVVAFQQSQADIRCNSARLPRVKALQWPDQCLESRRRTPPGQKDINRCTCAVLPATETGLVDARIIDNNDFMRMKVRQKIAKHSVLDCPGRPVHDHETRKVALFKGCLGDQPLWQLVVEVPYIHALHNSLAPRRCAPTSCIGLQFGRVYYMDAVLVANRVGIASVHMVVPEHWMGAGQSFRRKRWGRRAPGAAPAASMIQLRAVSLSFTTTAPA